ncbi:MAG: nucleotidyltransferase domain-containing protein [Candidatus Margulisiibacteriota bacterium]
MYSKTEIQQVVDKIKEAVAPDAVYLFGSYASGKPKENSDLDICVVKNNYEDKNAELIKIKKHTFSFSIPMDILLLKGDDFRKRQDIWGSVQYEIFHKGIKVYEK